ncbi:MAG: hypothetical protein IIA14_13700 [SAR324 cluster bacterium]|nr:hypothetical protein [SAR324 cluster bacterium]
MAPLALRMARFVVRGLLPGLLLAGLLVACEDSLEDLLEDGGGTPEQTTVSSATVQQNAPVPSGPHLYCITNIGHTLVAFSLTQGVVLTETRRFLELDPVGPWFVAGRGYYISRVDGSGAGSNALIEFDPRTLLPLRRINFPPNSNPTTLLPLPGGTIAYVALRGSTFDNFASTGVAVVDLATMAQTAYLDFLQPANFVAGQALASPEAFLWHAGCALGVPCAYLVVNNWRNVVRPGWLLVLEPAGGQAPAIRDAIALGLNPQGEPLLDAQGELWVVNNGGFADFAGAPGTIQVLDTALFGDGISGNETVAVLPIGGDPTGISAFSAAEGWINTYPASVIHRADLAANTLYPAPEPALPRLSGPLISTPQGVFGGMGAFSAARLGSIDPATGALLADIPLQSGNGPVSCRAFTNP